MSHKHASLEDAVRRLATEPGPGAFAVVDDWDADLYAIGIASPADPRVPARVSTAGMADDTFRVHLEPPSAPACGLPNTDGGVRGCRSFLDLAATVSAHLRGPSPRGVCAKGTTVRREEHTA